MTTTNRTPAAWCAAHEVQHELGGWEDDCVRVAVDAARWTEGGKPRPYPEGDLRAAVTMDAYDVDSLAEGVDGTNVTASIAATLAARADRRALRLAQADAHGERIICPVCGMGTSVRVSEDGRELHADECTATPRHDPETGALVLALTTCGTCGRTWNDATVSHLTPAPAARCPFEYDHDDQEDDD